MSRALIDYEDVFAEVLTDLYSKDAERRRLSIDFGWIPDIEINDAFADLAPVVRARRIRISVGLYSDLQGIANAIFRSSDFYTHIGSPSADRMIFADIIAGKEAEDQEDRAEGPVRQEAADLTVEIALAMIVLHEIGHHVRGHVRLGRPQNLHITESDDNPSNLPADMVRPFQACEIDADSFSFARVLELASRSEPPFRSQLRTSEAINYYFDLAVLAFTLVISLLHRHNYPLSFYEKLSHPHPAVRLYASQLRYAEYLEGVPSVMPSYQTAFQESLRVLQHNADQKITLALLASDRDLLAGMVADLDKEIAQVVRKEVRCYDFTSDRWRFVSK